MKLSIYSLKKILFQGEAELLNCKTVTGEITVLDNHETFIGVLTKGVMKVVEKPARNASSARNASRSDADGHSDAGGEHFFEITSGFLEVREGNEVRCIVE